MGLPVILALVNTLAVLGAIGALVYTKILFKRPPITEEVERKRVLKTKLEPSGPSEPGRMTFGPMTLNIQPYSARPGEKEGKPRYLVLAFVVELRDAGQIPLIESIRPALMDRLLALFSQKPFHELSSVQGRYLLRTQIVDIVNEMIAPLSAKPVALASAAKKKAEPAPAGEHGAPAEGHGGGGEHAASTEKEKPPGPPIAELYPEGLATQVYFNQFTVQ